MFTIKLILMTTGVCVWFVILAIAGGFTCFMVNNKICQMKARRMAKRRVKEWVSNEKI